MAGRILASATAEDWLRVLPADLDAAYAAAQQRSRASAVSHEPKPGRAAPAHAVTAAAGVTAALAILNVADVQAAARAMQWLITSNREHGRKVDRGTVASWGKGATAVLTAAQLVACGPYEFRNTELRYRAGTPMPTRPRHDTNSATQLAAKIPALMWPAFALRLTPPHLSFRHMSAGLAAAMLLVNSRLSFDEAIGLLGRPLTTQALSHVLKRLQSDPCWNDIRRAIIALADYLHNHTCPIDYQRRRTLDYTALLPEAAWRDICAAARIICTDTSLHLTQSHLYAVLSGNPVRHAPGYLDNPIFAAAIPAYPARLTPVAAEALQTAAQEFLHRAGIAEPLTWQPPLRLLDGLVLPGADPDTINIAALHQLIEHREPLNTVARQLNSTPEAVRHVLTLHPANVGPPSTTPALSALAATLPPEKFTALYRQKRTTLRDIAARYHADRRTVAALAHQYGIDTRHKPRLHEEIDRDWLYTEYVVHRRTLPELAAEKGMTTPNMSRWAQRHGIPRRPPGLASTAKNLKTTEDAEQAPATAAASPAPDRRRRTIDPVRNRAPISDPDRGGSRPGIAPGRAHPPDRPAGGGPRRSFNRTRPTRTTHDSHRAGRASPTGLESVEARHLTPSAEPPPRCTTSHRPVDLAAVQRVEGLYGHGEAGLRRRQTGPFRQCQKSGACAESK